MSNEAITIKKLRESLKDQLDAKLFFPDVYVLLSLALYLIAYGTFFYLALRYGGVFYFLIIPMGIIIQILSTINHEILHSNVIKSQTWIYIVTIPAMFLNITSPHFWTHTHLHHHRYLDIWTFRKSASSSLKGEIKKHSFFKRKLFFFDFFFLNSIQYRIRQITFLKDHGIKAILKDKNLMLITLELLTIYTVKIILFFYLGLFQWLLLELIPFLIYSFISSCFYVTGHSSGLGHMETKNIRIYTVRTNPFIDKFFLHLGYHVEHHIFPDIPQKHMPVISDFLQEKNIYPNHKFTHYEAIKKTYTYVYNKKFNQL